MIAIAKKKFRLTVDCEMEEIYNCSLIARKIEAIFSQECRKNLIMAFIFYSKVEVLGWNHSMYVVGVIQARETDTWDFVCLER